jgi:hypothetical protein
MVTKAPGPPTGNSITCADCGAALERIEYPRRLRPGERDGFLQRDPLCRACWQIDNEGVAGLLREAGKARRAEGERVLRGN